MTWSTDINERLNKIPGYLGTFPKDLLPKIYVFPSSLIMNTHPSHMQGEHWVAVYINKYGFGEFFDPYGLAPLVEEFSKFLNDNCPDGWIYNRDMIQGLTSVKCGEFCVVFIYLRNVYKLTMNQIVNIFSKKDLNINDVILDKIYHLFK